MRLHLIHPVFEIKTLTLLGISLFFNKKTLKGD
jgi:hypothetical protein